MTAPIILIKGIEVPSTHHIAKQVQAALELCGFKCRLIDNTSVYTIESFQEMLDRDSQQVRVVIVPKHLTVNVHPIKKEATP